MPQLEDLAKWLETHNIEHFRAEELVELDQPQKWSGGPLSVPPKRIWCNMRDTIILADHIRHIWGSPVEVNSGYRPREYNRAVGGAEKSRHVTFRALDLHPKNNKVGDFTKLCDHVILTLREFGEYSIGYGRYEWGVHLDVKHVSNYEYRNQRDWYGWEG